METAFGEVPKDQCISVLKISTAWRCLKLRQLAIGSLGYHLVSLFSPSRKSHLEKIALGKKYYISKWVHNGYASLVIQGNLSHEEMEELGAVASSKLLKIMLDNMKQPLKHPVWPTVDKLVQAAFQAELQGISEIENSYQLANREVE